MIGALKLCNNKMINYYMILKLSMNRNLIIKMNLCNINDIYMRIFRYLYYNYIYN